MVKKITTPQKRENDTVDNLASKRIRIFKMKNKRDSKRKITEFKKKIF